MTAILDAHTGDASVETLFTEGRSALRFSQQPVDADLIERAYDLAKWGPTANNSMPMRLVYAQSEHARERVIARLNEGNRPKAVAAPAILVVAADHNYHEYSHITSPGVDGLKERLDSQPQWREATALRSTWLQAGYLILALRAVGLDVRPIGGFDAAGLDADLFPGSNEHSQLVLLAGHPAPDGDHGAGDRRGRPSWEQAARVI